MQFVEDFFAPAERSASVLYVEDSHISREYTLKILEKRFPIIQTARNGQEGLEMFELLRPDIVITDIRMPVMDGITMAQKIKEIKRDAPIIITSAFGDRDVLMKSIRTGVTRFIMKPIQIDELMTTMEELQTLVQLQRRLNQQQAFIETVLDSQNLISVLTDGEFMAGANKKALQFTGYHSLDEFRAEHQCICELFIEEEGFLSPKEKWLRKILRAPVKQRAKMQDKVDGSVHIFSPHASPIPGVENRFIVSFFDITEIELQRLELEKRATVDPLTGVYNRHHFNTILEFNLQKRKRYDEDGSFALLMLDLDFFKNINDTYGHLIGDEILKQFTTRVQATIRKSDFLARWGGEEFAILAPEASLEHALVLAEKVRQAVGEYAFEGIDGSLTTSVGVTQFQLDDSIKSIVDRADRALYEAKNAGRNCVRHE